MPRITVPAADIELADGEIYAGLILNDDGTPSHHLVLLPGDHEDTTWQAAVDWAKSLGGDPRRDLVRAAALIIAEIDRLDRAEARKADTP